MQRNWTLVDNGNLNWLYNYSGELLVIIDKLIILIPPDIAFSLLNIFSTEMYSQLYYY